ncbi:hypothetical protein CEXT_23541 [Caerostris extrusa]|uniref:Uncharacterized protein n=1 Tax=Caerostris extrusa TaxID=172846 RepID=A0AAV4P6J5_CAEEX|nr:hypothetical protein CEXT_23541 [Caerostris extrusa]
MIFRLMRQAPSCVRVSADMVMRQNFSPRKRQQKNNVEGVSSKLRNYKNKNNGGGRKGFQYTSPPTCIYKAIMPYNKSPPHKKDRIG